MHHHVIGVWIGVAISLFTAIALPFWIILISSRKDGKPAAPERLTPIVRERIPGTRL